MTLDVPVQRPVLYQQPLSAEGDAGVGEYSEQVLRLMHSLGIDQHKTIEVRTEMEGELSFVYSTGMWRGDLKVKASDCEGCMRQWTMDVSHSTYVEC